jgi:hypothetical protein
LPDIANVQFEALHGSALRFQLASILYRALRSLNIWSQAILPLGRHTMAQKRETREEIKRRMDQRKPPSWAVRHDKPGSANKVLLFLLLGFVASFAVVWFLILKPLNQTSIAAPSNPAFQQAQLAEQAQQVEQVEQAQPQMAPTTSIPIPAAEHDFAKIIATSAQTYSSGATGAAKEAAEQQRAQAICRDFSTLHVSEWVGTVKIFSSPKTDRAILAISLDVQKPTQTGDQASGDSSSPPILIVASPPFLSAPSEMHAGEPVAFSGNFIPDSDGRECFHDYSKTADQGMKSPAYLMQLSNVKEAD